MLNLFARNFNSAGLFNIFYDNNNNMLLPTGNFAFDGGNYSTTFYDDYLSLLSFSFIFPEGTIFSSTNRYTSYMKVTKINICVNTGKNYERSDGKGRNQINKQK